MAEMTEEEFLKQFTPESGVSDEQAFLQKYAPVNNIPSTQGVLAGDSLPKDLLNGALEAVPFSNAPSEFAAGQRSGNQIFGYNPLGDVAGGVLGWGRALGTMLNPAGKLIGLVPKVTQAAGSLSAGGDLNQALQDLSGSRPISSAAEIAPIYTGNTNIDTVIGGLTGTYNEAIAKQPLSPLMFSRGALASQEAALRGLPGAVAETVRNLPAAAAEAGTRVAETTGKVAKSVKSAVKGETPVDLEEVAKAQKKIDDLQYTIEQNAIKRSTTLEERNVSDLVLEEKLARAQQEARDLNSQALRAQEELGPQIEALVRASEEAPAQAASLTERLPARQGESQFGGSMREEIGKTQNEAKPLAQEDYTAVREAADPNLRIETPELEQVAQKILSDKKAGYSAAFKRALKSVLGESVERSPIDPLKQLSAATRDIYERLPEAQKQNFLDQAGIKLGESQPKTYSWNELEQRYKDLNGFIEEAKKNSPTDVRYFTQLKNALSNEMSKYAEASGSEVKALFDEANANYSANAKRFGEVETLSKGSPESITAKIVGENKASTIEALKQVISPEKFKQVQSQYAHELFSSAKGLAFDPAHFLKTFEKFGDETLKSVFGEEGLQELYRIKNLAESGETAKSNQAQLSEFNKNAQAAEDAYQKAKSSSEEKKINDALRDKGEAALEANKDAMTKQKYQELLDDLKTANTPQKISLITRLIYGLGTGLTTGSVTAGIAAALFAKTLNRSLGKMITESIAKNQIKKDNP